MKHHFPRKIFGAMITLYQKTLSPDHGIPSVLFPHGFCPQHPTCSEYGKKMLLERGVIIGGALALKRIVTCHPWRKPDPERMRALAERELQK